MNPINHILNRARSKAVTLLAIALAVLAPSAGFAAEPAALLAQSTSAAIKRVSGDGSRVVYIFEDPLCSICRRLDGELQQLKNVTVYSFLIAVTSPEALEAAMDVYCAPSPGLALSELYVLGKYPEKRPRTAECKSRLTAAIDLAKQLRVVGTPTLLFPDGSRFDYLLSAPQIEKHLR